MFCAFPSLLLFVKHVLEWQFILAIVKPGLDNICR